MAHTYLGQNFLKNKKYIHKIISQLQKTSFSVGREIGPGKGALTQYLPSVFRNLVLFEKDKNMKPFLDNISTSNLQIIRGDILDLDIDEFIGSKDYDYHDIALIGNLPYYITSAILTKFFVQSHNFKYGIFMVQKEFANKVITDSPKKSYMRRMLNYAYDVKYICSVSAKSFKPAPKVDSAIISLKYHGNHTNIDFLLLHILLDKITTYKRKTLGKIWKMLDAQDGIITISNYKFYLPNPLQSKRLEQLDFKHIEQIINFNNKK